MPAVPEHRSPSPTVGTPASTQGAPAPLLMKGVRVLEVAAWTYVPSAGAVLAEWGADVLKIEHPQTGDPQRGLVTSGLVPKAAVNHMVELPNRGKRSVGIDLKTEQGHLLLMELAGTSDVFLTNFLPPAREALGIDVDDLRKANPNIIYVRGSGQGQRGPERDRGGFDGSAFWAKSIASIGSGAAGQWPAQQPGPAFGDLIGGLAIAGGIAAALFHRAQTGEALVVDNSLLGTAMWSVGSTLLATGITGSHQPMVADRTDVPNPIVNTYRSSDGRFLSLVMLQSDRYWAEFVTKSGRQDLAINPLFADAAARYENRRSCIAELDALFASKTFDEWRSILAQCEGVWAPVLTPEEVLTDPQVRANDYFREITLDNGESFEIVGAPIQFDGTSSVLRRAPNHGEHTDEVLMELGYDMDELIDLKVNGAIL